MSLNDTKIKVSTRLEIKTLAFMTKGVAVQGKIGIWNSGMYSRLVTDKTPNFIWLNINLDATGATLFNLTLSYCF